MAYSIGLFLHIFGVILMFMGVGITIAAMVAMLFSKQVEQVRLWSFLAEKADGLIPVSVLFILLPGLYLTFTTWGWTMAWINISLVVLVVMSVMGPMINLKRIRRIHSAAVAEQDGIIPAGLYQAIRDKVLWNSVSIMTLLAFGLVWLMTAKPGLLASLWALVVAVIAGAFVGNAALKKGSTETEAKSKTTIV